MLGVLLLVDWSLRPHEVGRFDLNKWKAKLEQWHAENREQLQNCATEWPVHNGREARA